MSIVDDVWTVAVPCEVCPEIRGSVARFSIAFRVHAYGGYRDIDWLVCRRCLDTCLEAAFVQHRDIGIPAVSLLPVPMDEYR